MGEHVNMLLVKLIQLHTFTYLKEAYSASCQFSSVSESSTFLVNLFISVSRESMVSNASATLDICSNCSLSNYKYNERLTDEGEKKEMIYVIYFNFYSVFSINLLLK